MWELSEREIGRDQRVEIHHTDSRALLHKTTACRVESSLSRSSTERESTACTQSGLDARYSVYMHAARYMYGNTPHESHAARMAAR